jgi:hypothetical protein
MFWFIRLPPAFSVAGGGAGTGSSTVMFKGRTEAVDNLGVEVSQVQGGKTGRRKDGVVGVGRGAHQVVFIEVGSL